MRRLLQIVGFDVVDLWTADHGEWLAGSLTKAVKRVLGCTVLRPLRWTSIQAKGRSANASPAGGLPPGLQSRVRAYDVLEQLEAWFNRTIGALAAPIIRIQNRHFAGAYMIAVGRKG